VGKYGKFVAGAIVGAALGVLFAPKAGVETRAFIKEKAQAYMDNADVLADNAKDKAVELYSTATDYAGDAGDQIRAKIETARGKFVKSDDVVADAANAVADATETPQA